jgi:transcription elongation factor Elf1
MDCEINGKLREAEAQASPKWDVRRQILPHSAFRPGLYCSPRSTMENQSGTAANSFCAKCGAPLIANAVFCGSCGQGVETPATQAGAPPMPPPPQPPQQFAAQPANVAGLNPPGLTCPRCGSNQVQAAKRGWKWTTGMIGSGKMTATCMQCGNKFDLN